MKIFKKLLLGFYMFGLSSSVSAQWQTVSGASHHLGNISIGTTNANAPLHIRKDNPGAIGGEIILDNDGTQAYNKTAITFADGGASYLRGQISVTSLSTTSPGQFDFSTGLSNLTSKLTILGAGNVGIGTSSPTGKLTVGNLQDMPGLQVTGNNSWISNADNNNYLSQNTYFRASAGQANALINGVDGNSYFSATGGNVGIGTTNPGSKFSIQGTEITSGSFTGSDLGLLRIANAGYDGNDIIAIDFGSGAYGSVPLARIGTQIKGDGTYLSFGTSNSYSTGITNVAITVAPTGNIGIGTTIPTQKLVVDGNIYTTGKISIGELDFNKLSSPTEDYKFAVNGTAIFNRAKVKLNAVWPDYVFEPEYNLPTLDSLENFIKLHKHLPEIPSASQAKINGIDLGDTQALLLKKIEELTIYIIKQGNKIEEQEKLLLQLKDSIDDYKITQ